MSEENKNSDDYELNKIRMKKIQALMDAQKEKQAVQEKAMDLNQKIEYILRIVLMPDAYQYLQKIKAEEPQVYQRIFNELISPDVIANIDYLLAIISRQGGVGRRIPLDAIIFLEREIKGIKGKIQVKRKDELMDLGSYLTK